MKKKLTLLAFSLLIAVGWTSQAFAQTSSTPEYTFKASDLAGWTYTWENAQGVPQTSNYVTYNPETDLYEAEKVTNPYQMYGLLRWIYMDPRFPGPFYSAYTADGVREREVYYGGIDGGWNIIGTPVTNGNTPTVNPVGNVVITTSSSYVGLLSIAVYDYNSGATLTSWTTSSSQPSLPSTWNPSKSYSYNSSSLGYSIYFSSGGTITIPSTLFNNSTKVRVVVRGRMDSSSYSGTVTVNDEPENLTATATDYEWIISGSTSGGDTGIGALTITGNNAGAAITKITVTSGNTTLFSWSHADNGYYFTPGLDVGNFSHSATTNTYGWINFGSALYTYVLQGWLFDGYNSVTVNITAFNRATSSGAASIIVNGIEKTVSTSYSSATNAYTNSWTFTSKSLTAPVQYQNDTYKPSVEGYTALVVKLKNNVTTVPADELLDVSLFETPQQIVDYFEENVESIQLLTNGLRIGSGEDRGTVFNASDEYNKFFFLSKGQSRQKTNMVLGEQKNRQHLLGEEVPFMQMFEQFSPTGGLKGSQITDFYSQMMQGKVYRVIHDCLSVIQNEHEFSMSGNDGYTSYAMTGLNFFIPDYRLKYWELTDTVKDRVTGATVMTYIADGRDMNPYQPASANKVADKSTFKKTPGNIAVWYAQYDTAHHAPLVGIYLIDLHAQANPYPGYDENHRYYQSTLDWTSSLNEMSGSGVKQTYVIYQVVTDSLGNKVNVPLDTIKNCTDFHPQETLDTLYQQQPHSYTITYVIQGWPSDSDHPGFIAWSLPVTVIIPGYDDFMTLKLNHYESDFDVNYTLERGKNYYRNYMQPENDFANGITAQSIIGGYDSFILYRTSAEDGKVPVAKLKLAVNNQGKVLYKITYFDENEDYDGPNNINVQQIINYLINNQ